MNNLDDKNKGNTDPAGDSRQSPPDPLSQASDNPAGPYKEVQSAEIIHNKKIPMPFIGIIHLMFKNE